MLRTEVDVADTDMSFEREADVLRRGVVLLAEKLPPAWKFDVAEDVPMGPDGQRADAVVNLTASDGSVATLVLEAKRSVVVRDLPAIVSRLEAAVAGLAGSGFDVVPVLVGRYLAASVRQWLQERGVSYVDVTGNVLVVVGKPALYLHVTGADRDPWRGPGRPRATLHGPPAARVVRALLDFSPPIAVTDLVRRSGASTGATYRVVEFLEREGLIEREPRGPISTVRWRRILERWSDDYGFQASNSVVGYLQPRGIPALLADLREAPDLSYALTGSFAAERLASYAPGRLAMLYAANPGEAASRLGLRAVETGANVLVAGTDYDVVFDRTVDADGLQFVAPSQAAVDLLTAPGRGPAEGQALLDWMVGHEPDWRR